MTGARLHRPYARKRGGPPSVTTVLGVLDKPGLPWAAARETAMFAVFHMPDWQSLGEADAVERLRKHHRGIWDGRAAMGTLVHQVNEAWAHDETVNIEDAIRDVLDAGRVWRDYTLDELIGEANRYLDGLEKFWTDFQPETLQAEDVVRHPGQNSYIGQRDWRCRVNGERWLMDVKTTAQQDDDKGLYPDTWRLQLAAYRYAEERVHYDETGEEIGTEANEPVDHCGIIHLRGDGNYRLYQVPAGRTEMNRSLQLRAI